MPQQNIPEIGKLIEGPAFRDAIHIAVAPVVAGCLLEPGMHVGLTYVKDKGMVAGNFAGVATIGIVDPFLNEFVQEGQKFWLFVYVNTVQNLRHSWTHPAFQISNLP